MQRLAAYAFALLFFSFVLSSEQPLELIVDTLELPKVCDEKSATGDKLSVHYTGRLFSNGEKFDSSLDRGQQFPIILGVGQVISGWDEGLQGMCVNEKRKLTIPSNKAYGSRGFGNIIPSNSALVFEVELLKLEKRTAHGEL